jgi:hypothetical protein
MLLPGGGLNATIAFFTGNSPFNAIKEFKGTVSLHHGGPAHAPIGHRPSNRKPAEKPQLSADRAQDTLALSVAT